MKRLTRTALELLQRHESAYVTHKGTSVDGRGKGSTLFINHTTGDALTRRGLAVESEDVEGFAMLDITDVGREVVL